MRTGSLKTFEIFLVIAVIMVGLAITFVYFPVVFLKKGCQQAQEDQIQNVWIKAKEMAESNKPGYEVIYFTVKKCARDFNYLTDKGALEVEYKIGDNDPFKKEYPFSQVWTYVNPPESRLDNSEGKNVDHTLWIFTNEVRVSD